jgi:hypothetical protein
VRPAGDIAGKILHLMAAVAATPAPDLIVVSPRAFKYAKRLGWISGN